MNGAIQPTHTKAPKNTFILSKIEYSSCGI